MSTQSPISDHEIRMAAARKEIEIIKSDLDLTNDDLRAIIQGDIPNTSAEPAQEY